MASLLKMLSRSRMTQVRDHPDIITTETNYITEENEEQRLIPSLASSPKYKSSHLTNASFPDDSRYYGHNFKYSAVWQRMKYKILTQLRMKQLMSDVKVFGTSPGNLTAMASFGLENHVIKKVDILLNKITQDPEQTRKLPPGVFNPSEFPNNV